MGAGRSQELLSIADVFTSQRVEPVMQGVMPGLASETMALVGGSAACGLADDESDVDLGIVLERADRSGICEEVLEGLGGRFHRVENVLLDIHVTRFSAFGGERLLSAAGSLDGWAI